MTRLARSAAVGIIGAVAMTGCSGPVPVHDTPGWGDLINGVQRELATIVPDPTPSTVEPDPVDPYEHLTRSSPNAVETYLSDLVVGQCILFPYDENVDLQDIVQVVPCEEPHYGEVYVTGELTRPLYPEDFGDIVAAFCEDGFEAYVGIDYWSSALYYDFSYASEFGWEQGYRGWRCYAYESDYENVGSVQGSQR